MKISLLGLGLVAALLLPLGTSCQKDPAAHAGAPTPNTTMDDRGAPSAPAPADPANATPKTSAQGKGYQLSVQPPGDAPAGAPSIVQLVLRPMAGYHVNKEFPTSLEISATAGIDVAKAKQTPADAAKFEDDGAAFEIKFTPSVAGTAKFTAVFKFAVCTETTCEPSRETLAWNVPVK